MGQRQALPEEALKAPEAEAAVPEVPAEEEREALTQPLMLVTMVLEVLRATEESAGLLGMEGLVVL